MDGWDDKRTSVCIVDVNMGCLSMESRMMMSSFIFGRKITYKSMGQEY